MQINSMRDIAVTVRGRRNDLGLSQGELAKRVGVSRLWINQFEAGKPTAEFGLVLRLLEVLELQIDLIHSIKGTDSSAEIPVDLDNLLREYRNR